MGASMTAGAGGGSVSLGAAGPRGYLAGLGVVVIGALLSMAGAELFQTNAFVLVFPLGVLVITARYGLGPAVVTAVAGVLMFDFLFVPPALAFALPGLRDGLTLVVMIAVAGVASVLAEQLRRQLRKAWRQTQIEQSRNDLLSALSHDLRSPLNVLVGASTALCDDGLDAGLRRDLSRMVAAEANRLNRLVSSLLGLTRLESGRVQVELTAQAVDEIIGAALLRLETRLEGRCVETHLSRSLPLAFFDPVLVEQVVVNLVENAVRHAGPASPITISAYARKDAREDCVVVEVADRGPGVPPGDETRVFERFYRAPGARQGDGGIGLGLTICRAIVAAHSGRIWFANRPGGGAQVFFTLPVSAEAHALSSSNSEPRLERALQS